MKRYHDEWFIFNRQIRLARSKGQELETVGKYRKRKCMDCGNPKCMLCHSEKILGIKSKKDKIADLIYKDWLNDVEST